MPKLWISFSWIIQVFVSTNLKKSQKFHYQTFGHSYKIVPNVDVKRETIKIKKKKTALKNTYLENILPSDEVKAKEESESQLLYLLWSPVPFIPFPYRNQDVFSICRIHTRFWQEIPTYQCGGREREMLISLSETGIMFRGFTRMNLEERNFLLQHCHLCPAHSHITRHTCASLFRISNPGISNHAGIMLLCCLEFLVAMCLAFSHFLLLDHLQESLECCNKWIVNFCSCGC